MMYNGEGYPAPTASAAFANITKENKFVYICSPYRNNPRVNVMRARNYCKFAVARGKIPLAPHLYFPQFVSEATERDKAMRMNFELLKLCSECWVFGDEITDLKSRRFFTLRQELSNIKGSRRFSVGL